MRPDPPGTPAPPASAPARGTANAQASAQVGAPRCISSQALLGDQRQVQIDHRGEVYRLLLTRQGKLILTK